MHKIMSTSSLPKLLTMTARVYMRRPKATSARTWKVMPNPRMRGTLLSPALDGSKTKVLLLADMLGRRRVVDSGARGGGAAIRGAGVAVSPREKEAERATISGSHKDDGFPGDDIPRLPGQDGPENRGKIRVCRVGFHQRCSASPMSIHRHPCRSSVPHAADVKAPAGCRSQVLGFGAKGHRRGSAFARRGSPEPGFWKLCACWREAGEKREKESCCC